MINFKKTGKEEGKQGNKPKKSTPLFKKNSYDPFSTVCLYEDIVLG